MWQWWSFFVFFALHHSLLQGEFLSQFWLSPALLALYGAFQELATVTTKFFPLITVNNENNLYPENLAMIEISMHRRLQRWSITGYILRDEILTTVLTEIQAYWCMTLLTDSYRRFGNASCLHLRHLGTPKRTPDHSKWRNMADYLNLQKTSTALRFAQSMGKRPFRTSNPYHSEAGLYQKCKGPKLFRFRQVPFHIGTVVRIFGAARVCRYGQVSVMPTFRIKQVSLY